MSAEPQRDQSIERLLRQSLHADPASAAPGSCLDAETLAAWLDGGLTASQLATAEAHLSACARCQAMVAALVKTHPALPEPQSQRSWSLGWLVPLAAGAAAIALWFAVPGRQRLVIPEAREPVSTDRLQAPAANGDELRASGETRRADEESKTGAARKPRDERAFDTTQPPSAEPRAIGEPSPQDSLGKLAAPPAPATPPPSANAAGSVAGRTPGTVATARLAERGASLEIASPDPTIRWRVGTGGSVQYSSNGGSTWEALSSGVTADLIAGAAPSSTVCWVVGRAGTVLLTTDGRRWQRMVFPEAADLVAVQATDARSATVTTADRRTFRTTDGGATWLPVQAF